MTAPVTVLYLGGAGRSGSTLLERMLGEVPGVVAAGELVHLAERGLLGDQTCACGEPFSACPFWQAVGETAFGGWSAVDEAEWARTQRLVDRNRYLLALVLPWSPAFRRRLRVHAERLGRLYTAIATVAGASIVVDSSKHVSTALVLRRVPGIDLHVVHLVRDSRGVAYSWTKSVTRPEVPDGSELMPRFHPAVAAAWWDFFNLGFHGVRALGTPTSFVRYEQLLDDPRATLGRLLADAVGPRGDEVGDFAFLGPASAELGPSHSVAGNPMRFHSGAVALRPDDAWRTQFSGRGRLVVTAITAPLLLAYGYVGRRADSRAAGAAAGVAGLRRLRPSTRPLRMRR